MDKYWVPIERVSLVCGSLIGAVLGYVAITGVTASPSLLNVVLIALFGGFLCAGALYLTTASVWIFIKLAILCKKQLQLPSEE